MSDDKLSEDGFKIWEKLYNNGHRVGLYDKNKPGATFVKFLTLDDMQNYFNTDKKYQNYQYVLCESNYMLGSVMSNFGIRKIRENTPLGTDD